MDRIPEWLPLHPTGGVVCGNCGGAGTKEYFEDRQITDACYHCGNTGSISPELALSDLIGGVAAHLAHRDISAERKAIDKAAAEEDGCEGWEFLAAERQMRGYELFNIRVDERANVIADELIKLPTWLQWQLVDDHHQTTERLRELAAAVPKLVKPARVAVDDDKIHF